MFNLQYYNMTEFYQLVKDGGLTEAEFTTALSTFAQAQYSEGLDHGYAEASA